MPRFSQIRVYVAKVPSYKAVLVRPLDCLTLIQDMSNLVRYSSICFVCSSESTMSQVILRQQGADAQNGVESVISSDYWRLHSFQ